MEVRRLDPHCAAEYRALMLLGYATEPEAFTATVAEREPLPVEWWETRISGEPDATQVVFGAFEDHLLVGVVGLGFEQRERTRHKAFLYGMFVHPEWTGRGIGRSLVETALAHAEAAPETRIVKLTVVASNLPAQRLYTSCGFSPFGTEPFANRIADRFYSLVHMWRSVHVE